MLPIETPRLRLRHFEPRDAPALARYRSDPAVARYQSWSEMTVAEAEAFVAEQPRPLFIHSDRWVQVAVADRSTDELAGDIGVCIRSPGGVAEIGFTFAPASQGRGYATEACRAAIGMLFGSAGVTTIEAVVDARNVSAIALVKRLGMSHDRTETAEFKGAPCSEHHFLLRRSSSQ